MLQNIVNQLEIINIEDFIAAHGIHIKDGDFSAKAICELILYCLLIDLDWEVRKNAIIFLKDWNELLCNLPQNAELKSVLGLKIASLSKMMYNDYDKTVSKAAKEMLKPEFVEDKEIDLIKLDLKNLLESAIIYLDRPEIESLSHHGHDVELNDVILDCY